MSTNNRTKGFPRSQSVSRRRPTHISAGLIKEIVARLSRLHQPVTEQFSSAIQSFDIDTIDNLLQNDSEIEHLKYSNRSALHIAIELIETGKISQSTLRSACINEKSEKCLNPLKRPDALRRIVKVLLESGRFNVNALTESSETVLHLAVYNCLCNRYSGDAYKHLVNAIIELLLKNNADINAKTSSGETPLMMASKFGCNHIVKLLLDWRDESGTGVDLNASDINGETALIMAAKLPEVDVVELLLQHGCVDAFQDNRGFHALHAVINGYEFPNSYARSDFLELAGAIASEERLVDRYAAHSQFGKAMLIDWTRNDSIQKTVTMLVTLGRADLNGKDFRGNTVLDLAHKSKHRINQKTVEMLKEYGANSCAVLSRHPEIRKITFQYTNILGKTPLHRLFAVLRISIIAFREQFDFIRHGLTSSPQKEAFEENLMTVAKDNRRRTVLHYAVSHSGSYVALESEHIPQLINVLKLKRTINTRDKYRRTPLHYCEDKDVYKSLVEQGANEYVQDVDGKTPLDLKQLRDEELNGRNLPGNLKDQLNLDNLDAWILWKDSEFAYRDPFSMKLLDKIRQFMNRLSEEVGKKDPRFECRPVLIGSAEEGTKLGLPDEFDFNFILTKFSELCEVVPSPVAPSGFVHLKRRSDNAECWPEFQHVKSEKEFDKSFTSAGFLLATQIVCRFRILYLEVLSEAKFWEYEDIFEWHPCSEVGMKYDKKKREFDSSKFSTDLDPSHHPCSTIQLKLNRPIDGRYMFTPISLDIVPCIKIKGWWPEKTLTSLSDEIKCEGCHLVFDQPQRNYQWVPFSDPFARISFAPAESRMIRKCSAVARAAYMVGKQLLHVRPEFTYVLKTCLLYCIEALNDCTSSSSLYEDIDPVELRYFVEKLMLCFHEFCLQDFLPCYMMPSFHLPIKHKFKSNQDEHPYNMKLVFPSFAYHLYRKVCTSESPVYLCPPTAEQLNENFNRDELMRKLSMERSYVENGFVYPKLFSTREMFRSDNKS